MTDQLTPTGGPTGIGSPGSSSDPGDRRPGLLRGRAIAAVAAIGIGIIAAVVIVSLTTNNGDAGDAEVISAEGATAPADPATADGASDDSADTVERSIELGTPSTTGDLSVSVVTDQDGLVRVDLDDQATPSLAQVAPQHCVLVTLSGPAVVETYGCIGITAQPELSRLTLSNPGDPAIGCAASATNVPLEGIQSTPGKSSFLVSEADELPAGTYDLSVSAVTGVGDGCSGATGPGQHVATGTAQLTLG